MKYDNGTKEISMIKGDFGIGLPFTITGGTVSNADTIKIVIKNRLDNTIVLEKPFTNIVNNKFDLSFTEEESKKLPVGTYLYNIEWFRNGVFMNTIRTNETFRVEDK